MNGDSQNPEKTKKQKNKDEKKNEENSESPLPQKKRTIEGGVQIEDIKVGNGPVTKSGKFISVYYVGKLKNGKKFDQALHGFRYGNKASPPVIPANSTLNFDVEPKPVH